MMDGSASPCLTCHCSLLFNKGCVCSFCLVLNYVVCFYIQVEELTHHAYQNLSDGGIAAFATRLTFHFLSCGAED